MSNISTARTDPAERQIPTCGYETRARGANRLYHGDNERVLSSLLQDSEVCGKAQFAYLDPPFATGRVWMTRDQVAAYDDTAAAPAAIESLRECLTLTYALLAPGATLCLHLDERLTAYARPVLDSIFGARQYLNTIVRKKRVSKNAASNSFGSVVDYLQVYTKSGPRVWNRLMLAWDDSAILTSFPREYNGRRYRTAPLHATGERDGLTGQTWRGVMPPPGKHWASTPEKLEAMDARGDIEWSPSGNPRRKVYADQSTGVPLTDLWTDAADDQNLIYPTAKPVKLLRRLVEAFTQSGDLVLDPFAGSGTTAVACEALGRPWILVDSSLEALRVMTARLPANSYTLYSEAANH